MGIYFRKSVKMGPLRLNFSKKGVGWSIGNKYYRYGKSATGNKYVSGGFHGIYYRRSLGKANKKSTHQQSTSPSVKLRETKYSSFFSNLLGISAVLTLLILAVLTVCLLWQAQGWSAWKFFKYYTLVSLSLLLFSMVAFLVDQEYGPDKEDYNDDLPEEELCDSQEDGEEIQNQQIATIEPETKEPVPTKQPLELKIEYNEETKPIFDSISRPIFFNLKRITEDGKSFYIVPANIWETAKSRI